MKRPGDVASSETLSDRRLNIWVHPLWNSFILFCEGLGYGEIEKLQIQDGLPVLALMVKRKIKFDPSGAKPMRKS